MLPSHAPCPIDIYKWVACARRLHGWSDLPAGTFDAHFRASVDAVAAHCGCCCHAAGGVAFHHPGPPQIDVDDDGGQAALSVLENLAGGVEDNWRTASAGETVEIVRCRLFEPSAQTPPAGGKRW